MGLRVGVEVESNACSQFFEDITVYVRAWGEGDCEWLIGGRLSYPLDVFSKAQVIGIQTRRVIPNLDKC